MRNLVVALVFSAAFAGPGAAATFDLSGDEIVIRRLAVGTIGNQSIPQIAAVSDTTEYQCTDPLSLNCPNGFSIDVGTASINLVHGGNFTAALPAMTIFGTFSFNGYVFEDLDPGMAIGDVDLLAFGTTGTPILSFTADSVTLDLRNVFFDPGDSLTLTLGPASTVIPVPPALPLAATAIALLALAARRGSRRSRRDLNSRWPGKLS